MEYGMAKRRIFVTEQELEALQQLLSSARSIVQRDYLDDLDQALNDAHVVSPEDKPANVVTINSEIQVRQVPSGNSKQYCLVFPRDSHIGDSRISVLSQLGSTLLGHRLGDEVSLDLPWGEKRFAIEAIRLLTEQTQKAA
jgi:regulator of nucleoside diphosphate kinase